MFRKGRENPSNCATIAQALDKESMLAFAIIQAPSTVKDIIVTLDRQLVKASERFLIFRACSRKTAEVPISGAAHRRTYCAGFVLELQHEPPKTNQNQNAKSLVLIGSRWFALVPVAVDFALETQRTTHRHS